MGGFGEQAGERTSNGACEVDLRACYLQKLMSLFWLIRIYG